MLYTRHIVPAFLVSVAAAAPAFAQDIQYEIVNNSALTLMEFYTTPSSVGTWDNDILGAQVLPSGSTGTVTIANGGAECRYDLLFVFEDGQQLTDTVDVCAVTSYTLQ